MFPGHSAPLFRRPADHHRVGLEPLGDLAVCIAVGVLVLGEALDERSGGVEGRTALM